MTRKIDPATLVAYLDGELKPSVAGEVEAALAGNAELRARLASLARVDVALAAAYEPVLQAPLPALVLTERPGSGSGAQPSRHRPAMRLAWAAGIGGLSLGFAAGQYGPSLVQPAAPAAVALIESQLPEILESEISGTTVAFSDPIQGITGTVKPISTFLNADGSYCRAFEARASGDEGSLTSRGVACRDQAGRWLTRVQVNAA
jgi:surface antigen